MNKTGIAAALAGAAGSVILGVAWYTGTQIESTLQAQIADANDRLVNRWPDHNLQLELTDFHRGLFSSEAIYALHAYNGHDQTITFSAISLIEHGPFPLSRLKRLELRPVMASLYTELEHSELTAPLFPPGSGVPMSAETVLHYDGAASGRLMIAGTEMARQSFNLAFSSLTLDFSVDAQQQSVKFDAQLKHARWMYAAEDPLTVELADVAYRGKRLLHPSNLPLGETEVSIGQLGITLASQPTLGISRMTQVDRMHEIDGMIYGDSRYDQGPLTFAGEDVASLSTRWSYGRLDTDAVRALADIFLSPLGNMARPGVAESRAKVEQALSTLLAGNPYINLDSLEITTRNGRSELSLAVELAAPTLSEFAAHSLGTQALSRMDARLSLSRAMLRDMVRAQALVDPDLDPRELEARADMLAATVGGMAIALNLATADGEDVLVSDLHYADGVLRLNGGEIGLEALAALVALARASEQATDELETDLLLGVRQDN